jgi:hypothetical protein
MTIKTGIQKRDGHALSGESLVGIHAQRSGKHKSVLLENRGMRIDLPLSAIKELDTSGAYFFDIQARIGLNDLLKTLRQGFGADQRSVPKLRANRAGMRRNVLGRQVVCGSDSVSHTSAHCKSAAPRAETRLCTFRM